MKIICTINYNTHNFQFTPLKIFLCLAPIYYFYLRPIIVITKLSNIRFVIVKYNIHLYLFPYRCSL